MGTHFNGTVEEVLALDTFIKLRRANAALTAHLGQSMSSYGLTESQFGALEALFHLGPMCQRALGEKLLSSGGNITMVVDNLQRRGLVERLRDPEDRRRVTVLLTRDGRSLIEAIFPAHVQVICAIFRVLSTDDQQRLSHLCRRLGLSLVGEKEAAAIEGEKESE